VRIASTESRNRAHSLAKSSSADLPASAAEADCPRRSPTSGAKFGFWHPNFVTLHLWAWYPNPDGIYNGTNRLVRPFNGD
jgi:hypothetical protein